MALSKQIESGNGVVTNYHRVVSVNTITNIQNIIEVASYTSESKREEEVSAIANGEDMIVYIHTCFFNVESDQNMTIADAYEWLKNRPEFEGAED